MFAKNYKKKNVTEQFKEITQNALTSHSVLY